MSCMCQQCRVSNACQCSHCKEYYRNQGGQVHKWKDYYDGLTNPYSQYNNCDMSENPRKEDTKKMKGVFGLAWLYDKASCECNPIAYDLEYLENSKSVNDRVSQILSCVQNKQSIPLPGQECLCYAIAAKKPSTNRRHPCYDDLRDISKENFLKNHDLSKAKICKKCNEEIIDDAEKCSCAMCESIETNKRHRNEVKPIKNSSHQGNNPVGKRNNSDNVIKNQNNEENPQNNKNNARKASKAVGTNKVSRNEESGGKNSNKLTESNSSSTNRSSKERIKTNNSEDVPKTLNLEEDSKRTRQDAEKGRNKRHKEDENEKKRDDDVEGKNKKREKRYGEDESKKRASEDDSEGNEPPDDSESDNRDNRRFDNENNHKSRGGNGNKKKKGYEDEDFNGELDERNHINKKCQYCYMTQLQPSNGETAKSKQCKKCNVKTTKEKCVCGMCDLESKNNLENSKRATRTSKETVHVEKNNRRNGASAKSRYCGPCNVKIKKDSEKCSCTQCDRKPSSSTVSTEIEIAEVKSREFPQEITEVTSKLRKISSLKKNLSSMDNQYENARKNSKSAEKNCCCCNRSGCLCEAGKSACGKGQATPEGSEKSERTFIITKKKPSCCYDHQSCWQQYYAFFRRKNKYRKLLGILVLLSVFVVAWYINYLLKEPKKCRFRFY